MSFILFILLFSTTCLYSREISFGPFFQQNLDLEENVDPLYEAILKEDLPTANMFLQNGANIHYIDQEGQTLIHLAAQFNYCEIIDNLIKRGAKLDIQDNQGNTALHSAIDYRKLEAANLLINNGANTRLVNNEGENLLHLIARLNCNTFEMINTLIQKNAKLGAKNKRGKTPLQVALDCGNVDVIREFIRHRAECNFVLPEHLFILVNYNLLSSLCEGDLDEIKDKLEENSIFAKIETKDHLLTSIGGRLENVISPYVEDTTVTLLHLAASSSNAATIKFLLTCGGNVNIVKLWESTPLNCAVLSEKTDNVEVLLAHGASLKFLSKKERNYVEKHIESQLKSYLEKTGPIVAKSTFLLFKK